MRTFELIDGERRGARPCGVLSYDPKTGEFSFAFAEGVREDEVPLAFAPFVARGERLIPSRWVKAWVEERIAPPARQNIGEVLRAHDLTAYDPCELLASSRGRSTQDGFYLREIVRDDRWALEVGAMLARARAQAGITQEELASRSGLSQVVVSLVECGKANPTVKTLGKLAEGLGMRLAISFESPAEFDDDRR